MSRLIRKSWIVFVQAITLSFESIMVELLTEIPGDIFSVSSRHQHSIRRRDIAPHLGRSFKKNYSIQLMEVVACGLDIPCCGGVLVV